MTVISCHSRAWAYLLVYLPVYFAVLLSAGDCSRVVGRYWDYEPLPAVLQAVRDSHYSDVDLPVGRMNCRTGFHSHSETG